MKKITFLIYGITCYVIFLGAFLHAIGFVSGLFLLKNIDSTPQSPLGFAILVDAGLLTLFALQHSIMARPAFKKWWIKIVPEPIERSTYVLFSSMCLLLIFWQWQPIGGVIWKAGPEAFTLILQILCFVGFGIVLISIFLINHFDLLGLRQVWFYFTEKKYEPLSFTTPFLYKYVRHPIYLGFIIAFWATSTMTVAHLFFAIMTTGYILVGIKLEENDLVKHFGEKYKSYKQTVSMIIPFTKNSKR